MKRFLIAMTSILLFSGMIYAADEREKSDENGGGETTVAESSTGMSKGESFMAAFGMSESSTVGGGETSTSGTGASAVAATASATAATVTGTVIGNQGMVPPFTPYYYYPKISK